jgi:hypothetical protein
MQSLRPAIYFSTKKEWETGMVPLKEFYLKSSGANSYRHLRQVCHSWAVRGEM